MYMNTHKMHMRAMTVLGLGAAFLLTASVGSCSPKQAMPQQIPAIEVQTVDTTSEDLNTYYPAIIRGKTDIAIRPQVSGFITKVHVDEGQHVRKGQVLFTIDQVQYQATVEQAHAAVNSAQAAVNTAASNERNQKMLFEKNIISQTQWQTAADALAQARAALAQAQAALVSAKKNLSYTIVTAPSDGVVGSIPQREGSLASPSSTQPLTTISDNSQVYAYFSLNEKELLKLTNNGEYSLDERVGRLPKVSLMLADGSVYPLQGRVATVSGVIDNTTGAAQVRALFDNPKAMLRSGSTGNVIIPTHSHNVILVPQKATFEIQDMKYVYTVNDTNGTVPTQIKVLDLNDGKSYVVTDGLKPGDRIVVEGVGTSVRDNMKIKPVTAQEKAAMEAKK